MWPRTSRTRPPTFLRTDGKVGVFGLAQAGGLAIDRHVVERIGEDHAGTPTIAVRLKRIGADETMLIQKPEGRPRSSG